MRFEDRSRDTFENAVSTRRPLAPGAAETWLLITSASHMPRAIGAFRRADFPVIAYPVDYAVGPVPSWSDFSLSAQAMRGSERALREYLGLLAYFLSDRSRALFPAPAQQ